MHCWSQSREPKTITSKLITAGSPSEVVTLSEFKQWIKWPDTDNSEDVVMQINITSATEQAQDYIGRALLPGQWQSIIDGFYSKVVFDVSPVDVASIVVKYYDDNNGLQTLASTEYKVKDYGNDQYAEIDFTGTMPIIYDRYDAVRIEFNAGYTVFPQRVKNAILIQAAGYFENRQSEVSGSSNAVVFGFHQLLFPLKML